MAETHIIAVHTYGSQRVKDPLTKQVISAYKIGYSSAASAVLLALFRSKARNVSSSHASYHYVQVDGDTSVRHGYLLLKLTANELAQAEATTRQYHRAAAFLWRDGKWLEFPNNRDASYTTPLPRSGPDFNPSGYRPVSPSTGEKETAVEGIHAEKSQRSPNEKPWWWLLGDTYPHRDLLKRWGARFSSKRRAWYYVGWELPEAICQLIAENSGSEPETDDAPCSDEEAAAILGIPIKSEMPQGIPSRLFQMGDTVYARHELETQDGTPVPTGTRGMISRLYNHNAQHGWSYDVDFDGIGTGWYFERELTNAEPLPGIRVTRGLVVPPGIEQPPTDADLKRALIESDNLPQALANTALAVEPETLPASDTLEEPQCIRVFKPLPMPADGEPLDDVQKAIAQAKKQPTTAVVVPAACQKRTLAQIRQAYVGELTGSISGNVYCYGYAVNDGVCVYLNMGGPRMAVEAIRAKLSKGDIVSVTPWDGPAVELTAGDGNTGMYHDYFQNIPEAKFTSLILCHDLLVNPKYGGKASTFIFRTSDEQATAKLKYHVAELVKVPVFDEWAAYLYHAGQTAMLVRKTRAEGGIDLLTINLDVDAWTRLITGGVEQGVISLPL